MSLIDDASNLYNMSCLQTYEDEVAIVVEINRQLQEATAALDLKESKLAVSYFQI